MPMLMPMLILMPMRMLMLMLLFCCERYAIYAVVVVMRTLQACLGINFLHVVPPSTFRGTRSDASRGLPRPCLLTTEGYCTRKNGRSAHLAAHARDEDDTLEDTED